jgi:sepiapterin reductase
MQQEVRETLYDEESRTIYTDMHTEGKLVHPDTSAAKLVELLLKDRFESGAHLDFYDV